MKTKFKETEIGKIPKDWEETTLGGIVTFQRGYDLPLKNMKKGKYPVLKSNGIAGYHNEFKAKGPGIVIGRSGKLGEPFYIEKDYWPHNTTLFTRKFHNSYPKFVYYFLKKMNLIKYNAGSAVPTLNRNHIHPIPIIVPQNIEEQKSIAKILSDLDSKIELNQKMNKTLEAIGKAIFKQWFIDFEFPNEEGKPYKSSSGEMAYIEELDKEIPKGWEIKKLNNFGNIICGKTPPKSNKDYFGGNIPFIKIPDMHHQVFIINTEDSLTEKGKLYQENKTIPLNSICVSCIATVGLVAITSKESQTNQQINSIIPYEEYLIYYLFYALKSIKR